VAGWDPSQYLKFAGPRARPALDLLAQVALEAPRSVFDLGCGAGNITRIMAGRWPGAMVTGVDGSADMLAKARSGDGAITWLHADLGRWSPPAPADVLYSNAALHWLDDHAALFPRLLEGLRPGGVLAVQMPRNHAEASHTCMVEAARAGPWRDRLAPVLRPSPVAPPEVYHDILAPVAGALDLWETVYIHALDGDNPVVEWTKGSALKPLLDALGGADREGFLADYTRRIAAAYPQRADGTTLFPFRRLFMVAVR
jgi:trans-aconitate 2-methyltransferase